jgi:hypothetical protein
MSCLQNSWMYGNVAYNITGTRYGVLGRLTTPSSLPSVNCLTTYWVGCRSTTLDESGANRFYQTAIAYVSSAGRWCFSWGYSTKHLSQRPYTGLYPTTNHSYELGIKFTGTNVILYVVDLSNGQTYSMGTVPDSGTMVTSTDQPSFLLESYAGVIGDMNVPAFELYTFNYFLTPSSSSEWPGAKVFTQPSDGSTIPNEVHTSNDLGSHHYLIGNTTQGSKKSNGTILW